MTAPRYDRKQLKSNLAQSEPSTHDSTVQGKCLLPAAVSIGRTHGYRKRIVEEPELAQTQTLAAK